MLTRKELLSQLTDAKGNIRVLARIRPLQEGEEASALICEDDSTVYAPPTALSASLSGSTTTTPSLAPSLSAPSLSAMMQSSSTMSGSASGVAAPLNLKRFQFDRVFGPHAHQEELYDEVEMFPASLLDGYNCCLFAYGQTGSGKTFTMEGTPNAPGLNCRILKSIFEEAAQRENTTFEMHVSVLEIYNEIILDLLDPATGSTPRLASDGLKLRQGERGVFVQDAIRTKVTSFEQVKQATDLAGSVRATASTDMNERSSRSHCIVSLEVHGRKHNDDTVTHSRLFLIDLAGSERVAQSGAQGKALEEAKHINKSLSTLSRVFECLQMKRQHIPFRDSVLTYILKDSLVDAKTAMILNLSPSSSSYAQSVNSLNFGVRVRKIERSAPKKNFDIDRDRFNATKSVLEAELAAAKLENAGLLSQLTQLSNETSSHRIKHSEQLSSLQLHIQQLQLAHAQEIAALKAAHAQDVASLKRALAEVSQQRLADATIAHKKVIAVTKLMSPVGMTAATAMLPNQKENDGPNASPTSDAKPKAIDFYSDAKLPDHHTTSTQKYVHQLTPIKPKSPHRIADIEEAATPIKSSPLADYLAPSSLLPIMDHNGVLLPVVMTPQLSQKRPAIMNASPLGLVFSPAPVVVRASASAPVPSVFDELIASTQVQAVPMSLQRSADSIPSTSAPIATAAAMQVRLLHKSSFLDRTHPDRPKKSVSFSNNDEVFVETVPIRKLPPPAPLAHSSSSAVVAKRAAPASPIKSVPVRPTPSSTMPGARRVVAKSSQPPVSTAPKATPARVRPVATTATAPARTNERLTGPPAVYKIY